MLSLMGYIRMSARTCIFRIGPPYRIWLSECARYDAVEMVFANPDLVLICPDSRGAPPIELRCRAAAASGAALEARRSVRAATFSEPVEHREGGCGEGSDSDGEEEAGGGGTAVASPSGDPAPAPPPPVPPLQGIAGGGGGAPTAPPCGGGGGGGATLPVLKLPPPAEPGRFDLVVEVTTRMSCVRAHAYAFPMRAAPFDTCAACCVT